MKIQFTAACRSRYNVEGRGVLLTLVSVRQDVLNSAGPLLEFMSRVGFLVVDLNLLHTILQQQLSKRKFVVISGGYARPDPEGQTVTY